MSFARTFLTASSVVLFSFHGTGEAAAGSHPAGVSPEGLGQQPALCEGGQKIPGAALSPNGSVLRTPSIVGPVYIHTSVSLRIFNRGVRIDADLNGALGGKNVIANEPFGVDAIPNDTWVNAVAVPESLRAGVSISDLPPWLDPDGFSHFTVDWNNKPWEEGQLCRDVNGKTWSWRERGKEEE